MFTGLAQFRSEFKFKKINDKLDYSFDLQLKKLQLVKEGYEMTNEYDPLRL